MSLSPPTTAGRRPVQRAGLLLGLIVFVFFASCSPFEGLVAGNAQKLALAPDHAQVQEVARGAQLTFAIMLLMLTWWVTEAAPLPVTALLPGLLLPLFHVTGQEGGALFPFVSRAALANYANPIIYLFLGGFLLAAGMRKSRLDRRITLHVLSRGAVSRSAPRMILAVMCVTAVLSMLISNTATAAMMIPIALGMLEVLDEMPDRSRVGTAMMLGICWSASLGGIGTLIGSPPNLIAVGMLREAGVADIEFTAWMRLGLPVAVCGVLVAWLLLLALFRPYRVLGENLRASLLEKRRAQGPMSADEITVIAVVALALLLWMTHATWKDWLPAALYQRIEWFGVPEMGLLGGLLLFVIPVKRSTWRSVLTWSDTRYVDWGTLLLFGGGLTLSAAMFKTGVTDWIAGGLISRLGGWSPIICLGAVILLVDYMTEIASNTAVTTMITPLLIVVAPGLGIAPVTLCVAAAMASSLAFMLPVATPPNALVYATGYFRLSQMIRAGCLMNLLGCAVLLALIVLLGY